MVALQVFIHHAAAETIVSFGNRHAIKKHYQHSALILALERTIPTHGTYTMNYIKEPMNAKRTKVDLKKGTYPNLVAASVGNTAEFEQFSYAPFPIELGVLGFRFPILHINNAAVYSTFNSIEQLNTLRIIQGVGWFDSKILEENGFSQVIEVKDEAFGKMLLADRADLYFSSLSDINTHLTDTIVLNKSFVLYYHSPRFYIASKKNSAIIERIYHGLTLAFDDGSLEKLLNDYFSNVLLKVDFKKRNVIKLENSRIKNIDKRYFQWVKKLDRENPT
jgi:hypothetical protein